MRPVPGHPRFSVGVAAVTWLATLLAGYSLTLVVFNITGHAGDPVELLPAWATVVSVTALWIPELIGLRHVSARWGTGRLSADYGLSVRRVDLLGIPIGVLSQLVVLELVYWPLRGLFPATFARKVVDRPARDLFDRAEGLWLVLIVACVCIGAPIVEELMYRGLILRSIDGRIADSLGILCSAGWFALAHVQAVQLPGLFVFGVILAVCAQRTRRLGMSIFAHAAFNATTVVLLLVRGLDGTLIRR